MTNYQQNYRGGDPHGAKMRGQFTPSALPNQQIDLPPLNGRVLQELAWRSEVTMREGLAMFQRLLAECMAADATTQANLMPLLRSAEAAMLGGLAVNRAVLANRPTAAPLALYDDVEAGQFGYCDDCGVALDAIGRCGCTRL